ncbi:MAG: hypothetical protein ACK55Z_07645, partial [bacterium]
TLNGENVPCVVLPLRVMVKALLDPSMNVLFCAPLVPLPCNSSVTFSKYGSYAGHVPFLMACVT